jgi:acetylornithine deacetylase/succinyl-diaminopimelate desuccinylase-like protein
MLIRTAGALGFALAVQLAIAQEPPMGPLRADQATFFSLYKELVETNTTLSVGNCTAAAERIAGHLKAAGFEDKDVTLFSVPSHPKEGGVVAVLNGTSNSAKPMLLLGHLDVVEAKREDWTRDPFTLIEEDGYFYGRGTSDMKAMDATWIDALMRFKHDGYHPKRTIKMALTCGEETTYAFNGAEWLAKNRPKLISAAFALNEGGGGRTDGHGKLVVESIQVGEKAMQNYLFETINAGGHSSIPIRDNAIYELADALARVRDHEFPVKFTDTTRAFFAKAGAARDDELGRAMVALSHNPDDQAAETIVSRDRSYHSMLRTTCVATLLSGGHANNALPQRATANVNCRIFPGETVDETQAALVATIADPGVKVTAEPPVRPIAVPPPLDPKIMIPTEKLVAKYFPGVPLVPTMSTGATDGIFLEAIGIPVYGAPGGWGDPDGNGVHGLNERRSIRSVFVGRDFLIDLIKAYADAKWSEWDELGDKSNERQNSAVEWPVGSAFVKDCPIPAHVRTTMQARRVLAGRCWTILKGGNRGIVLMRSERAGRYGELRVGANV